MDKKEANLLPRFCTTYDDSSSSDGSSDESTDSEEPRMYRMDNSVSKNLDSVDGKTAARSKRTNKKIKKKQSKWSTYWSRYKRFVHSPRVHFVYDAVFYIVFLMLFNYMILCEFNYYEEEIVDYNTLNEHGSHRYARSVNITTQSPLNSTNRTNNEFYQKFNSSIKNTEIGKIKKVKLPSWIEYLLIYWIFAFMAEEARQVIFIYINQYVKLIFLNAFFYAQYFYGDAETKVLKNKLLHYFENNWNYLDISGCLVFSIGMSLRFLSITTNENLFIAARYIEIV